MKKILCILALLVFASPVFASDSDQKVTYWLAETDSSGFTIQNIGADFPVYLGTSLEQSSGVNNIALNDVRLRNGVLARPTDPRRTRILNYDALTAHAYLSAPLTADASLNRKLALLIGDYAVDQVSLGLADSITVVRTVVDSSGVNVSQAIAGFRRSN